MKAYSLKKSRQIMLWYNSWYKKKGKTLSTEQLASLENHLETLDQALLSQNRDAADQAAQKLETFGNDRCKKSPLDYIWEIGFALVFALAIATVVRQVWFELYEIPTGSMRPTFREQDHLTVTKTPFGINVPLQAEHLYFDPDLVQRGGIVIWSGHNIDLPNTYARYFGIIPYKKQYIKRLIGKPGDSLYFYGGKIYGIDKEGNSIQELLNDPVMQKLEHLPFISFEGRHSKPKPSEIIFRHMNQPIGKFSPSLFGKTKGEIFNGKKWIRDQSKKSSQGKISTYSDFFWHAQLCNGTSSHKRPAHR